MARPVKTVVALPPASADTLNRVFRLHVEGDADEHRVTAHLADGTYGWRRIDGAAEAHVMNATGSVATNVPAALREFPTGLPSRRTKADLAAKTQARFVVSVYDALGPAGSTIRPQWSTDAAAWGEFAASATVSLAAAATTATAWAAIPAGARTDVWLRLVTENGDGTADPEVGVATLQVR